MQSCYNYSFQDTMNKESLKQFITYKPSYYSNALKKYQKHTFKKINPFIKIIGANSLYSVKYPIYQMLKACVKLLMLNELQIVMAAICFKTTNWDINNQIIKNSYEQVGQLICSPHASSQYKQLTLYILLIGWVAKSTMNEDCKFLEDQIKKLSFNFRSIFQNWLSKNCNILTIHPRTFNRIYSGFINQKEYQMKDYQLMVDAILQISHHYSMKQPQKESAYKKKEFQVTKRDGIQINTKEVKGIPFYSANFTPFQVNNDHKFDNVQPRIESLHIFQNKSINNSFDGMRIFQSRNFGDILGNSIIIKNRRLTSDSYYEVEIEQNSHEIIEFHEVQNLQLSNIFGLFKGDSTSEKKQEDHLSRYFPF